MKIKSCLIKLISCSVFSIFQLQMIDGQSLKQEWFLTMGSSGSDAGQSIVTDGDGDIYTVGYFQDTLFSENNQKLISNGQYDVFIKKTSPNGDLLWINSIGGPGSDFAFGIDVDTSNNIFVTGKFEDSVDFDPNNGEFTLSSTGDFDGFILKINHSGDFEWVKQLSSLDEVRCEKIKVDPDQNIAIIGVFKGSCDFDPGTNEKIEISGGEYDGFFLNLNKDGDFNWLLTQSGESDVEPTSLGIDNEGDFLITGYYFGEVNFDPGSNNAIINSIGSADSFILKIDKQGSLIWAKSYGGSLQVRSYSIALNSKNEIYLTGYFYGGADFDPSSANFDLSSNGSSDIYVLKLDSAGIFNWVKSFGGSSVDKGLVITLDNKGNLYSSGVFRKTVDFGTTGSPRELTSSGAADTYIMKMDSMGSITWIKSIFGSSNSEPYSINLTNEDDIYLTGFYSGLTYAGLSSDTATSQIFNGIDIFTLKLNTCGLNSSISVLPDKLIANALEVSYSWLDCQNSFNNLGVTSREIAPDRSGEFAVEISGLGCIDTSSCENISILKTQELNHSQNISIFPNPTTNFTYLQTKNISVDKITIYNELGLKISQLHTNDMLPIKIYLPKAPGIYLVKVHSKQNNWVTRILVE